MSLQTGALSHVGVGQQSVLGTAVAPSKWFRARRLAGGLERPIVEAGNFDGRTLKRHYRSMRQVPYEIEADLHYEGFDLLFLHAFGADSGPTQQGGTSEYNNTFSLADALVAGGGLTLETKKGGSGGQAYRTKDCRVASFGFRYERGQAVVAFFRLLGRDEAMEAAPGTPTYPTHLPVIWSAVTIEIGGSAAQLVSAEIDCDNGLAIEPQFGSDLMLEPVGARRAIAVRAVANFEGDAILALLRTDAALDLRFNAVGAAIPSGNGGSFTHDLDIPNIAVASAKLDIAGPGLLQVAIEGMAEYNNAGAADAMTLAVKNTISTNP